MNIGRRQTHPPAYHQCELKKDSDSCLPKLPPQTNCWKRIFRRLWKYIIVTRGNYNCKLFLRSHSAITTEKRRHIRSQHWYIIHPFSWLCIYREIMMSLLWLFVYFKDPFTLAFFMTEKRIDSYFWLNISESITDVLLWLNIIFCFFSGYFISSTKEIVLQPRKIATRYLRTYFIFDLIGAAPSNHLLHKMLGVSDKRVLTICACLHVTTYIRLKTMTTYLRQITGLFKLSDMVHDIICLVIITTLFLHWWSCLVYLIPKLYYKIYNKYPHDSWVIQAEILPFNDVGLWRMYIESLLTTVCHFYMSGIGMYQAKHSLEEVMFSVMIMTGYVYFAYMVITTFQIMGSANASESKYEEIKYQLYEYMQTKKLPAHLRSRLLTYYDNKFQRHYFREQAILSTLSEHLRQELFLHSCRSLVDKVGLFQGLSKATIGDIVGYLKQEVYLPNDVIIAAGSTAEAMYFIANGTVTVTLPSGKEITHLEDGDHFGGVSLILKATEQIRMANVVAIEMTECFRIDKKDLWRCITLYEEFANRIGKMAQERYDAMKAEEDNESEIQLQERADVLHELREGKILFRSRKRQTFSNK